MPNLLTPVIFFDLAPHELVRSSSRRHPEAGAILPPDKSIHGTFFAANEKFGRPDQTGSIQCCEAPISIIIR
ncbi:MAG: hypothetical protein WBQ29_10940, partial [Isosphaeraceae bacterium]